ncbi:major facilitator superfamily domain-containing protein [Triangularia verruculosa]|uniref:Major facilitator superfamily domain-containing protein n=1 Tax=Triangularia verruculosa TaxID=2587418 RepID=A0AAN6XD91_9PEZI|nr:major facilitator superfamily domain-containing protein [Triangularia verruculosa]
MPPDARLQMDSPTIEMGALSKKEDACAFPSSSDLSTQENAGGQPVVTRIADERDLQTEPTPPAPSSVPSPPNESATRSSAPPGTTIKRALPSPAPQTGQNCIQNQNSASYTIRNWSYWNTWDANDAMAGIDGHDGAMEGTTSSSRRWLALAALACMWTNAQAPLFMFAGAPVYIYSELGGIDHWVWFVSANLLATAAISPFVGALSDLIGRRYVALAGNALIVIGQIICGAATSMDAFIVGMAISGLGTGVNELTALAGAAEIVPVSRRGYYVAAMILTILPFLPSVMYAQLISAYSSWRYIAVVTTGWAAIGLVMAFLFYHPPPRIDTHTVEKAEVLKKTDWFGGFLSITGLVLVEVGLLGGGYNAPWASARVLAPLIIGMLVLVGFVVWERKGTSHPMVPRNLGNSSWNLWLTLIITFISGANFFSVLMIWPSEAYNVYGHDPVGVGIRGMPFAFGTMAGCVISLVMLSWLRGNIKWILFASSTLMTIGCGLLSIARVDNIQTVYGILFIAGLGVGGVVVPASTITAIICPNEVIATVTALTIAIRIVGGAIGYAIYYNVFVSKLVPQLNNVGGTCAKLGITDPKMIGHIIELTGASLVKEIRHLPGITDEKWAAIVAAGQVAYSHAYPWAYYCSIAFGGVSILASLFLGNLNMDDSVAVVL